MMVRRISGGLTPTSSGAPVFFKPSKGEIDHDKINEEEEPPEKSDEDSNQ